MFGERDDVLNALKERFGGVAPGNQATEKRPAHRSAKRREQRLRSQRQACGRRIVTSHVEKFALDGERSSQMLMRIERHHGNVSPVMSGPPPKPSIRVPARLGNALILAFAIVFGGWGYFAPLDGGAVAPGVINPDSGKKTIQHLEGGIIAEMPRSRGRSRDQSANRWSSLKARKRAPRTRRLCSNAGHF